MNASVDAVRVAGTPDGPLPVVVLAVEGETDVVPIFVGLSEARSIAQGLDAVDIGRPLTHDLTLDLLEELGSRVTRVVVSAIEDGTYLADLYVQSPREEVVLDARPSDCLALAVRTNVPIEVAESVFEQNCEAAEEFADLQEFSEVVEP
jgi:bifunctional DNase/RNase